jgi:hypothetical protein
MIDFDALDGQVEINRTPQNDVVLGLVVAAKAATDAELMAEHAIYLAQAPLCPEFTEEDPETGEEVPGVPYNPK